MAARRVADYTLHLAEDLYNFSLKKQTGISLKHMMDFVPTRKNLLLSAQFLHKELPVRLAHRVIELENLPYGLSEKAPILQVSIFCRTPLHSICSIYKKFGAFSFMGK